MIFFFNAGYLIDEKRKLPEKESDEDFVFPKLNPSKFICSGEGAWKDQRKRGETFFIDFLRTNRNYKLLDSRFKILWSYANRRHFYFTDKKVIWGRNRFCSIGSDSKNEIMYLLSLLNSRIMDFFLKLLLKNENEKSLLISISAIKQYARPPLIHSKQKEKTKVRIVELTEKMLDMERRILGDWIELDTLIQSFEDVYYEGEKLILKANNLRIEAGISLGAEALIQKTLKEYFSGQNKSAGKRSVDLEDLLALPAFDQEARTRLKDKIDDLVFDLYELDKAEREYILGSSSD